MERPARSLFFLTLAIAGLLVWASCFVVLYGGLSLGCIVGLNEVRIGGLNALSVALGMAALAHAAALLVFLRYLLRERAAAASPITASPFLRRLASVIAATGLAAIVFTSAPLLFAPPCESQMVPLHGAQPAVRG